MSDSIWYLTMLVYIFKLNISIEDIRAMSSTNITYSLGNLACCEK